MNCLTMSVLNLLIPVLENVSNLLEDLTLMRFLVSAFYPLSHFNYCCCARTFQ